MFASAVHGAPIPVQATANIFGAGHTTAPNPGGGGGGTLPAEFDFTPGAGLILTVTNVTGTVTLDQANKPVNDADGGTSYSKTAITSFGGISGISHDTRTMFLVGVFLDATEPSGTGPAILSYTSTNTGLPSYSPLLDQTFFIGDGLTGDGSGSIQQFVVPAGAARLFLGFADGFDGSTISGPPGYYNDNSGVLMVNVQVASPSVPCPSLSIVNQTNSVILAWSSAATNASLQAASVLASNSWTRVTNTPAVVGTNFVVTSTVMPGQMFYRLLCQ